MPAQSPAPSSDPAGGGRDLRKMMLTTPPGAIGEKPSKEFPRVYGVLMDLPVGDQTATVFSSASGAASLYTTSTFGIIGGEGHESVRNAAKKFVRAADRHFTAARPTTEYPYPTADRIRFYLLTFDGVRVLEAELAATATGRGEYSDLFDLGQAVLTELRLTTEKS